MSANTDHAEDDRETAAGPSLDESPNGGDAPPPESEWAPVPGDGDGATVEVRWSDLRAMRTRIDELAAENADLRTELQAADRRRNAVVDRYERLLQRRTGSSPGGADALGRKAAARPDRTGDRTSGKDRSGDDRGGDDPTGILARVFARFP